jgi:hypothetical protein
LERTPRAGGILPGARDGQQGGQAGAVVGDARAAEAAIRVHRDIVLIARRDHGVQVRGQRHVRRRALRRDHVAGAVDGGIPAIGAELLQEPGGALLLQKRGRRHAAKLQVRLVDPLLLAREPLQALAVERDEWRRAFEDLKRSGKVQSVGVSATEHDPDSALAIMRTGLIDAVQVIYNIFDQTPEARMLPLAREMNIGILARVPLDEGALTGTIDETPPSRPAISASTISAAPIARNRWWSTSPRCAATSAKASACPIPRSASACRTRPFPASSRACVRGATWNRTPR